MKGKVKSFGEVAIARSLISLIIEHLILLTMSADGEQPPSLWFPAHTSCGIKGLGSFQGAVWGWSRLLPEKTTSIHGFGLQHSLRFSLHIFRDLRPSLNN